MQRLIDEYKQEQEEEDNHEADDLLAAAEEDLQHHEQTDQDNDIVMAWDGLDGQGDRGRSSLPAPGASRTAAQSTASTSPSRPLR